MDVRLEFVRYRHERGELSDEGEYRVEILDMGSEAIRSSIEFPLSRLAGEGDRG